MGEKEAYIRAGFRAFRSFDGRAANFGDTSISASSSHPEQIAAYVSSDSKVPGRIVIVAINRSSANVSTSFAGLPSSGSVRVFRMSAASAAGQREIAPIPVESVPLSGSILRLALPFLSVSTIEIMPLVSANGGGEFRRAAALPPLHGEVETDRRAGEIAVGIIR